MSRQKKSLPCLVCAQLATDVKLYQINNITSEKHYPFVFQPSDEVIFGAFTTESWINVPTGLSTSVCLPVCM